MVSLALVAGFGWRYSDVLLMISTTALLVTSAFWRQRNPSQWCFLVNQNSFFRTDILLRCKFACYPFEVLEVVIQLGPLCSSNLLTDHLKTQQPEQLTALLLTGYCIVKIWQYDTYADRGHHMMHSNDRKGLKEEDFPPFPSVVLFNSTLAQNVLLLLVEQTIKMCTSHPILSLYCNCNYNSTH